MSCEAHKANKLLIQSRLNKIEMWFVGDSFITAKRFLLALTNKFYPDAVPVPSKLTQYKDLLLVLGATLISDEHQKIRVRPSCAHQDIHSVLCSQFNVRSDFSDMEIIMPCGKSIHIHKLVIRSRSHHIFDV